MLAPCHAQATLRLELGLPSAVGYVVPVRQSPTRPHTPRGEHEAQARLGLGARREARVPRSVARCSSLQHAGPRVSSVLDEQLIEPVGKAIRKTPACAAELSQADAWIEDFDPCASAAAGQPQRPRARGSLLAPSSEFGRVRRHGVPSLTEFIKANVDFFWIGTVT